MTHQQFSTFKVRKPSDNQVLLNVFQKNRQKVLRIVSEFLATCDKTLQLMDFFYSRYVSILNLLQDLFEFEA